MDVEGYGCLFFFCIILWCLCLAETLVKFHKVTLLPSFCPFLAHQLSYPTWRKPCGGWATVMPLALKSGLLSLAYSSLSINCMLNQMLMTSNHQLLVMCQPFYTWLYNVFKWVSLLHFSLWVRANWESLYSLLVEKNIYVSTGIWTTIWSLFWRIFFFFFLIFEPCGGLLRTEQSFSLVGLLVGWFFCPLL